MLRSAPGAGLWRRVGLFGIRRDQNVVRTFRSRQQCGHGVRNSPSKRGFHPLSLDAINFLLADVRGALGPYLNVFLVTQQHWSQSEVGLVTTIGGLLGLAVQTPIGAAIDETRAKRGVIVLALAVLALGRRRHLRVADLLAGR